MKYIVKCDDCDSINLEKLDYIEGQGESFKCLDCENEMTLRYLEFKEVRIRKIKESIILKEENNKLKEIIRDLEDGIKNRKINSMGL